MKSAISVFLCAAAATVNAGFVFGWQSGEIMRAMAGLSNGVSVRFSTVCDPPCRGQDAATLGGGFRTTDKAIHRFFVDQRRGVYFGYDMETEPLPKSRQVRLTFRPLSMAWEYAQRLSRDRTLTESLIPTYPGAILLDDEGMVILEVLKDPKTGQKVVDRIRASLNKPLPIRDAFGEEQRDFRLDDVELRLSKPVLRVNGGVVASSGNPGVRGPILWINVPERGRFVFSLRPHEGYDFRRLGVIEQDRLSFKVGEEGYVLNSSEPILTSAGGVWNLYVLHEASHKPRAQAVAAESGTPPSSKGLTFGAAGRIEYVFQK